MQKKMVNLLFNFLLPQVKTAYQKLCDEKEKNVVVINIEHITEEVMKERKRLLNKGVSGAMLCMSMLSYVLKYSI